MPILWPVVVEVGRKTAGSSRVPSSETGFSSSEVISRCFQRPQYTHTIRSEIWGPKWKVLECFSRLTHVEGDGDSPELPPAFVPVLEVSSIWGCHA